MQVQFKGVLMSHAKFIVTSKEATITREIKFNPMPEEKRNRIVGREIRKYLRKGFKLQSVAMW